MNTRPPHLPAEERREATVESVIELAKDAIWEAVMQWVATRLMARVDRAIASHDSALDALEAVFLTHAAFVAEHPGVPRMLFGELQRAEDTAAKRAARTLLAAYGKRVRQLIVKGQQRGELSQDIEPDAAAAMFVGAIQGLVMQTLLSGEPQHIRSAAPGAFALYRRCIGSTK
ncbi:MAG: TetR/AcrR family transcriptional regulator C-terminal domain-containing protein [Thiomonas arsenitoxydans]|uniref:TetR/AcrR family transcriptional regulator C-terminal domain-containing protein n=1 Tax=Thiomonas arsenitoxydans (strain DSM 22701 / CIP 110005 / 3As) TaxID=426114 RepID=A0A8I1MZ04_THIA3|nr:TetR/AcrR family transcriptional regulator C-terminal domain-containing protein [Thiomonas arsenitoxydans]MBN8744883.1 TetR/AcrR family transcriptional regulator C-terminal domain-containing protein [Thiomonas arsenitoxydans]